MTYIQELDLIERMCTMNEKEAIMNRWLNLFPFEDYERNKVVAVYDKIVESYCSPTRHHHTMNHIEFMLDRIDEMFNIYQFDDQPHQKFALYCAAFFHDIVYDPQTTHELSDEERSADVAIQCLKDIGITSIKVLEHVYELIILTKTHQIDNTYLSSTTMQAIMVDSDIAVLGAHREDYLQYAKNIALEYDFVGERDFRAGRAKFLHDILSREAIFNTEYMRQLYEADARLNIRTEVAVLDKLSIDDLLNDVTNPEG